MSDLISNDFTREEPGKLPSGLNVLTILTIIGSILAIVGSIWNFVAARQNYERTRDALGSSKLDEAPGWAKGMINPEMLALQQKMLENKLPIMIIGLAGAALCLYGALEMRKRKKQGYILWLVGEILPIIGSILFIGMASMKGIGLLGIFIPLIFIILYTVNKKELIY